MIAFIIIAILFAIVRYFISPGASGHAVKSYEAFAHLFMGVLGACWYYEEAAWLGWIFCLLTAWEVFCAVGSRKFPQFFPLVILLLLPLLSIGCASNASSDALEAYKTFHSGNIALNSQRTFSVFRMKANPGEQMDITITGLAEFEMEAPLAPLPLLSAMPRSEAGYRAVEKIAGSVVTGVLGWKGLGVMSDIATQPAQQPFVLERDFVTVQGN